MTSNIPAYGSHNTMAPWAAASLLRTKDISMALWPATSQLMEATIQWPHEQRHHCLGGDISVAPWPAASQLVEATVRWHREQQHQCLGRGTSPWHRERRHPGSWCHFGGCLRCLPLLPGIYYKKLFILVVVDNSDMGSLCGAASLNGYRSPWLVLGCIVWNWLTWCSEPLLKQWLNVCTHNVYYIKQ